jgi:hypothetical protein
MAMTLALFFRRPTVHKLSPAPFDNHFDSAIKRAARNSFWRADPGLNINANKERQMSMTPDTPGIRPAQYTDPLIVNARLVNLAAEIERNLAARRALRPARSDAAKRGWEVRRDR